MFYVGVMFVIIRMNGVGSEKVQSSENSFSSGSIHMTFHPQPLVLFLGSHSVGYINVTMVNHTYLANGSVRLHSCVSDQEISQIVDQLGNSDTYLDKARIFFNVSFKATLLGRTTVRFYVTHNPTEGNEAIQNTHYYTSIVFQSDGSDNGRGNGTSVGFHEVQMKEQAHAGSGTSPIEHVTSSRHTSNRQHDILNRTGDVDVIAAAMKHSSQQYHNGYNGPTSDNLISAVHNSMNSLESCDAFVSNPTSHTKDKHGFHWWLVGEYSVVVRRRNKWLEKWLDCVVMVLIGINMVGIGGQVDEGELLCLVKRPVALSIGLLCRFCIMPAIGLSLVELMLSNHQMALGVLTFLSSPHEGVSSLMVLLAEENLTLSVALMVVLNFTVVALLPLWTIVFETRLYTNRSRVRIPFNQIFMVFGYTLISVAIGFCLKKRCSRVYKKFWMFMPAFSSLTVIFIIFVEVYKSEFIFQLIHARIALLSFTLAMAGYVFSCAISLVAKQSNSTSAVIALETGCRSTYVTVLLLNMSLDNPESDTARTTPVLTSLLTLIPCFVTVLVYRIYSVHRRYQVDDVKCSDEGDKTEPLTGNEDAQSDVDTDENERIVSTIVM